jgi:hypothetical protein
MSNTYTWSIKQLECSPLENGQSNVVSNVHWCVTAISDQNETIKLVDGTTISTPYSAYVCGVQPLTYTTGTPFTDYFNLTETTVVEWVQAAMGSEQVSAIEESLAIKVKNLMNPLIITSFLPWIKT